MAVNTFSHMLMEKLVLSKQRGHKRGGLQAPHWSVSVGMKSRVCSIPTTFLVHKEENPFGLSSAEC